MRRWDWREWPRSFWQRFAGILPRAIYQLRQAGLAQLLQLGEPLHSWTTGIAADLFYHVAAPLNICGDEPQFPHKVMGLVAHIQNFLDRVRSRQQPVLNADVGAKPPGILATGRLPGDRWRDDPLL